MLRLILKDIVSLSAQAIAFRMTVGAAKEDTICLLTPMRSPENPLQGDVARQTIGIPGKSGIEAKRIGF
jgi:hypothetical protein